MKQWCAHFTDKQVEVKWLAQATQARFEPMQSGSESMFYLLCFS